MPAGLGIVAGALAGALSVPVVATAAAPRDWLRSDCGIAGDARPEQPTPTLLRVRTRPDESGFDAILLRMPDGWLYAPAEVFAALDIDPPEDPQRFAATPYFALDRVAGLAYAVDPCTQTLSIDRSGIGQATQRRLTGTSTRTYARPEAGGYLQANAVYLLADRQSGLSAVAEAGLFGAAGFGNTSVLVRDHSAIRLDTTWTVDAPDRMTRLRVGDGISRGGLFGRSVRFGGVQWGRDFSLRPDLVTFPLPSLADSAALPSAVDVYVNNMLRARTDVPAGPFQLSDVPALSGAGDIQIVVTDVLGRQHVSEYSYYATPELLNTGLSDYTVEAGFERGDYTLDSWSYDRAFGAATWRYGVNDRLTVETHVEGNSRLQGAGAGVSLLLPAAGVLTIGLGQGFGDSEGGQVIASLSRQGRTWGYDISHQANSADYLRIGETAPQSTRRDLVRTNWRLPRRASLSLAWLDTEVPLIGHVTTANLGYSQQLGRNLSLNVGFTRDLRHDDGDLVFAGLSWVLTPEDSVFASWQHSDAGAITGVSAQHSTLGNVGWSSRASLETGVRERFNTALSARLPSAQLGAEIEDSSQQAIRLSADSGLIFLGSDVGASRPLTGPFALVATNSPTPVRVRYENRDAGTAVGSRPLLVPNLRPYQHNRISIEQHDVAMDARLYDFEQRVLAPGYGGVRVRFDADVEATRRIELRLRDGSPVPAGANLRLDGLPSQSFVGYGGEMLLSGSPGTHEIVAIWADGRCNALATLAAGDGLRATPLQLTCRLPSDAGATRP